jgi:hypothetical protein
MEARVAHTLLLMYATGAVALRPRAPRVQGQVILRQNRPILPPGIVTAYLRRQGDAYINSNVCATPSFFHFSAIRDHLAGQSPNRSCDLEFSDGAGADSVFVGVCVLPQGRDIAGAQLSGRGRISLRMFRTTSLFGGGKVIVARKIADPRDQEC